MYLFISEKCNISFTHIKCIYLLVHLFEMTNGYIFWLRFNTFDNKTDEANKSHAAGIIHNSTSIITEDLWPESVSK